MPPFSRRPVGLFQYCIIFQNEVAEAVAHRHWVCSVPKMLRPYFKFDRALLKDLCRIVRCLLGWMCEAISFG